VGLCIPNNKKFVITRGKIQGATLYNDIVLDGKDLTLSECKFDGCNITKSCLDNITLSTTHIKSDQIHIVSKTDSGNYINDHSDSIQEWLKNHPKIIYLYKTDKSK